jgi:molybdopterin synthase sulfur carrier subunit
MPLKLVFIGRLEDVAGEAERRVDSVASLDLVLSALEPDLAAALSGERIRLAINGEVVIDRGPISLSDGDELAFLPPVSGG